MKTERQKIQMSPATCQRLVEEWLTTADLRCTSSQLEDHLGMAFENIRYRLRQVGTTWYRLKHAERRRRMELMLATGADQPELCAALGFSLVRLQQFFKRETGMHFRDYKKQRDRS